MPHHHNKNLRHTHRIFVPDDLNEGVIISASQEQSHHLQHVLRMQTTDAVRLFNGRDGEYCGTIEIAGKKTLRITLHERLREQNVSPDLWLCCAPIKKNHFDFMIEKATELGAQEIRPILTGRTQVREVNTDRVWSVCREAAEQSERLSVPKVLSPVDLAEMIKTFPEDRALIVCAETGEALPILEALASEQAQSFDKAAILTGPEGGFADEELETLRKHPNALFVRLGPRILRADTAALAALTCWQASRGDWKTDQ